MKTLIIILVLFSSSLFAQDIIPAPFGIQLGQPLSEDIMCKGKDGKKNYSKKNYIKEFGQIAYDYLECLNLVIPPKKNDKYSRYDLSVRGEDLIVGSVLASQHYVREIFNLEIVKEYQKNLIEFLINKYKVKRVLGIPIYICSTLLPLNSKDTPDSLRIKLEKFCKKEEELSVALGDIYSKSAADKNYYKKQIKHRLLKKQWDENYSERIISRDECYHLFSSKLSENLQQIIYPEQCDIFVQLENDLLIINVTTAPNEPGYYSIRYELKKSVQEANEDFIERQKELEQLDKERQELIKKSVTVDQKTL